MDENRSFHWEFDDSLRFFKCMSERNWSTHHTSNVAYLPVRVRSHAPCGLEKKYLTWFIPKRSLWQNQHPLPFKRHMQQTINKQSVKLLKNVSCSFSKTRNCKLQIIIRIVFLEVQDIKDELPSESCFSFSWYGGKGDALPQQCSVLQAMIWVVGIHINQAWQGVWRTCRFESYYHVQ